MANRNRSVVVGFIDLPAPVVMRTNYETAAWHTDALVPAGRYLLEECVDNYSGRKYWAADFPGVIVHEYMPALWGGVPVGKSPQGDQHPNVGKGHTSRRWWDDFAMGYFAEEVARSGSYVFVDERTREKVAARVTLFATEAALRYRWWSCHSDSHYHPPLPGRPAHISCEVSRGFRGRLVERFELRAPLLLSAGERRRSELGTAVGAVLKAWGELENDPMSDAVGIHPDPTPTLRRIASEHGWTLEELAEATSSRGVSPKWVYFSGLGALSEPANSRS